MRAFNFILMILWTSLSNGQTCVDLFDRKSVSYNIPFEKNLVTQTKKIIGIDQSTTVEFKDISGFQSLKINWPLGRLSGLLSIKNMISLLTPNPQIIGPYDLKKIGAFVGPRLFVSSSKLNTIFKIQITVEGQVYQSSFNIRRNPTFIGLRAIDFISLNTGQKLESWPAKISEINFGTEEINKVELYLHGALDITFNPRPDDLFNVLEGQNVTLTEYLLSKVEISENRGLTSKDIQDFLKIYKDFFNRKKTVFAKKLNLEGPEAIRQFLNERGFDSRHLIIGGQLTMRDYLLNFRNTDRFGFINIPSEPGYFGEAHGPYSHALQMVALLKDLTPNELGLAQKVMRAMTNADHPQSWLAWAGLFNGFSGDGPHTTPWWPE